MYECPDCGETTGHAPTCYRNPSYQSYLDNSQRQDGQQGCSGCTIGILAMLAVVAGIGALLAGAMGIIAPNRGMEPLHVSAIESLVDRPWVGQVLCGEELRGISATFDRRIRAQEHVSGTITWHDGVNAAGPELGEYRVNGTFDGTRLRVHPAGGSMPTANRRSLTLSGDLVDGYIDMEAETIELYQFSGPVSGDDACQEFWIARSPE